MNNKHRKTLGEVFADPVDGAIEWSRIEGLLLAVGCRRVPARVHRSRLSVTGFERISIARILTKNHCAIE
jgi:hypothetical protein